MFDRIYKFLKSEIGEFFGMAFVIIGVFAVGIYAGSALILISKIAPAKECVQDKDLIKQSAKQGVHEFLNEFGLEYRKKSR